MTTTRRHAFTLIELLLCVAIIALLVSFVLPSLKMARLIAHELACKANLRSLNTAVVLYYNEHDSVPVPPVRLIDLPGGHTELVDALADYHDGQRPSMEERRGPWACPSDTLKWPDTGGSYVYYPRHLYESLVLALPHTTMRAIMQSRRRIPIMFDFYPQHGPRFNVVYFDGGVDSEHEAVTFAWP